MSARIGVTVTGGPLDGQTLMVSKGTVRLELKHPESDGEGPSIGMYRRDNGWRYEAFGGRA